MTIVEDRYDGVTIDYSTLPDSKEKFEAELAALLESLTGKRLLWVKIPIEKSCFIPILTNLGFEYHHCSSNQLMLVKRLMEHSILPTAQNYVVGIGAIVLHEGKLLVVRDKFSEGYKLPGGHIDNNESMKDALKREVLEETGVLVELDAVVNLGHFTIGQFGESCIYVVCTAHAKTMEITIYDSSEIVEARWLDLDHFLNSPATNNYNKSVVKAALNGQEYRMTEQHISLKVAGAEVFF